MQLIFTCILIYREHRRTRLTYKRLSYIIIYHILNDNTFCKLYTVIISCILYITIVEVRIRSRLGGGFYTIYRNVRPCGGILDRFCPRGMQGCPTAAAAVARVLALGGSGVVGERGMVWRKQGWKWDICTRVVDKSSVSLSLSILSIFFLFPPRPYSLLQTRRLRCPDARGSNLLFGGPTAYAQNQRPFH